MFANNIKQSWHMVTRKEVEKCLENHSNTAKGVPAKNIWSYEIHFCEDPGSCKAVFKKGTKYAEG
jgi:hypothetical protein